MKTRITDLFGLRYPIFQGGMAWVAEAHLAAAVSNAGGLGIIGAGGADPEWVEAQIDLCQSLTDAPFGVNLMLMNPKAEQIADLICQKGVKVVTTGAGSPEKYMARFNKADVKVVPVVASVALAKRMERGGADAVIAEGTESGGHIGELTTMALVPQIVDAVSIPVIAAGGIGDGRGMAAALMLGAEGVQMGTRFLLADETQIHDAYKEKVVKAKDIDSAVTGRTTGHPVRVLRNQMSKKYIQMEKEGVSFEELEYLTLGSLRKAVVEGDQSAGSFMAGQIAGLVHKRQSCAEILDEVAAQAIEQIQMVRENFF